MIKRPSYIKTNEQFFAWEREEEKRLRSIKGHLETELRTVIADLTTLRHWSNNLHGGGWGS